MSQPKFKNVKAKLIGWLPRLNDRLPNDYGDCSEGFPTSGLKPELVKEGHYNGPDGIVRSMAIHGFDDSQNVLLVPIELTDVTQKELRTYYWNLSVELCKEQLTAPVGDFIRREFGYDTEGNTDHVWQFIGMSCNRRSLARFYACTLQEYCDGRTTSPLPSLAVLPCKLFDSLEDAQQAHALENLIKNVGTRVLSANSMAVSAHRRAESGQAMSESDLVNKFGWKRGQAQRDWGIVRLARRFPELRIIERLSAPVPAVGDDKRVPYVADGYIDAGTLHKDGPRRLCDEKAVPTDKGDPGFASDAADVESYIKSRMTGQAALVKTMARDKIKVLADASKVQQIKDLLAAIVRDDSETAMLVVRAIDKSYARLASLETQAAEMQAELDCLREADTIAE